MRLEGKCDPTYHRASQTSLCLAASPPPQIKKERVAAVARERHSGNTLFILFRLKRRILLFCKEAFDVNYSICPARGRQSVKNKLPVVLAMQACIENSHHAAVLMGTQ